MNRIALTWTIGISSLGFSTGALSAWDDGFETYRFSSPKVVAKCPASWGVKLQSESTASFTIEFLLPTPTDDNTGAGWARVSAAPREASDFLAHFDSSDRGDGTSEDPSGVLTHRKAVRLSANDIVQSQVIKATQSAPVFALRRYILTETHVIEVAADLPLITSEPRWLRQLLKEANSVFSQVMVDGERQVPIVIDYTIGKPGDESIPVVRVDR